MEEGYMSLPSSHLLGSVPAMIAEKNQTPVPTANLQVFPPPESPYGGQEQDTNNWIGLFSISSYTSYFSVDIDVVVDRIISSVYPMYDFSRKIEANPDMYGPVWISTKLLFVLAALGNYATYLIHKRCEPNSDWELDVSCVNWAACAIYGYAVALPAAFYFLLKYFGHNAREDLKSGIPYLIQDFASIAIEDLSQHRQIEL